jgi:hypothetical protein
MRLTRATRRVFGALALTVVMVLATTAGPAVARPYRYQIVGPDASFACINLGDIYADASQTLGAVSMTLSGTDLSIKITVRKGMASEHYNVWAYTPDSGCNITVATGSLTTNARGTGTLTLSGTLSSGTSVRVFMSDSHGYGRWSQDGIFTSPSSG